MNRSIALLNKLTSPIRAALQRVQGRFNRARAGSVLIMVVALLVLLALMGTAYMATARLDREGSAPLKAAANTSDTITDMLQGQVYDLQSRISVDSEFTTSAMSSADAERWLAPREPSLAPMYLPPGAAVPPAASYDGYLNWPTSKLPGNPPAPAPLPTLGHLPSWATLSRPLKGVRFDIPLNLNGGPGANKLQWDIDGTNSTSILVPTNIVIQYPNTVGVSDDLVQRTRVYPAFDRYQYAIDATHRVTLSRDTSGPFFAADSTGWGVADSGLVQINNTPIDGITYYYSIRAVDNAAALNANVAWKPGSDQIGTAEPQMFFPPSIDLLGFLQQSRGMKEMEAGAPPGSTSVLAQWMQNKTNVYNIGTSPNVDPGTARNDYKFTTLAEAVWEEYGSRLDHTGFQNTVGNRFGSATNIGTRAFGSADQASLAYRGVFTNPDAGRAPIDDVFFKAVNGINAPFPSPAVADSLYVTAMNYTDQSKNSFRFVTARDAIYWFDYYFNWEGVVDSRWNTSEPAPFNKPVTGNQNLGGIGNQLGLAFSGAEAGALVPRTTGIPFRNPRAALVVSNPVANRANVPAGLFANMLTKFPAVVSTAVPNPPVTAPYSRMAQYSNVSGYTPKVSLNTAPFEDLWRGYFLTMIETNPLPALAGGEVFKVPHTQGGPGPTGVSKGTFRSSIRNNDDNGKGGDSSNQSNNWKVTFDKYNQLLLRSAIAAVNTIDIRDSDGMSGTNKIGNVTTKKIALTANVSGTPTPVEVTVYGTEAHPYITEIYAQTDTVTKDSNGNVNDRGFVAIELFNPYPYPLPLAHYKLAVLDRHPGGTMQLTEITAATAGIKNLTVPAGGFIVLHNFNNGGGDNAKYLPQSFNNGNTTTLPVPIAAFHPVQDITMGFEGGGAAGTSKGGELFLMRAHNSVAGTSPASDGGADWDEANIQDWVPVDSYDFTGLTVTKANQNMAAVWHYSRIVNTTPADAWKCVYPGKCTVTPPSTSAPHFIDTKQNTWNPTAQPAGKDLWDPTGDPKTTGQHFGRTKVAARATVVNPYPGIQLNNFNSGNKAATATNNKFPFGGFARVGDILQVPFIGSYRIRAPGASTTLMDLATVSIDSAFVDDADTNDDAVELLGRFCPITVPAKSIDDLNPLGTYDITLVPMAAGVREVDWRYRWATKIFDNFTVIANPDDDYMPNVDPGTDPEYPGRKYPGPVPVAKPNSTVVAGSQLTAPKSKSEDGLPVEGLININNASWRVLAAMQMIPDGKGGNKPWNFSGIPVGTAPSYNDMLAKFIVYFRDVDDGMYRDAAGNTKQHPHGPFQSLAELNAVHDPTSWNAASNSYTRTFQNALGLLTVATTTVDSTWGNYASVNAASSLVNHMVANDFEREFLMVDRISNLVTTRSDSFTCYVMVQGWRNANTPFPELVAQKRAAFIIDRSKSTGTTFTYTSNTVETR